MSDKELKRELRLIQKQDNPFINLLLKSNNLEG